MIHTVYVKPTLVLDGTVIDKCTATIEEVMKSDTEMRVVPDSAVPNTLSSPTISDYVVAEDSDGYKVISITNTTIITEN